MTITHRLQYPNFPGPFLSGSKFRAEQIERLPDPHAHVHIVQTTTNCTGFETSRNDSSAMRVDLLPQMDEKPFAGRRKKRVTTSKFRGRTAIRVLYVGHGLFLRKMSKEKRFSSSIRKLRKELPNVGQFHDKNHIGLRHQFRRHHRRAMAPQINAV